MQPHEAGIIAAEMFHEVISLHFYLLIQKNFFYVFFKVWLVQFYCRYSHFHEYYLVCKGSTTMTYYESFSSFPVKMLLHVKTYIFISWSFYHTHIYYSLIHYEFTLSNDYLFLTKQILKDFLQNQFSRFGKLSI